MTFRHEVIDDGLLFMPPTFFTNESVVENFMPEGPLFRLGQTDRRSPLNNIRQFLYLRTKVSYEWS